MPKPEEAEAAATQCTKLLTRLHDAHNEPADGIFIVLYRDPEVGQHRAQVVVETTSLAKQFMQAAREAGLHQKEVLLVSGGLWSSYVCTNADCCPPDATPVRSSHNPGPISTAYTLAGKAPFASFDAIQAMLRPDDTLNSDAMRRSLATAEAEPIAASESHRLLLDRLSFDEMPNTEQTAQLLIALRDREFRDLASAYSEESERPAAAGLWRHLAVNCVTPYQELAAAPLTLLAWNTWLLGDTVVARAALAEVLNIDPEYTLAGLLRSAFMAPGHIEPLQEFLRKLRAEFQSGSSELPER
ncbi:hypothetical protein KCMC57_up56230 [Kitasatospora sp. CMC57]|uniref:DUF4192 domain-containing protein n=2 Tax=Kitasatospora sp. CMC57 TaxID=3231513 RepID=A0AB33K168_9ACTN